MQAKQGLPRSKEFDLRSARKAGKTSYERRFARPHEFFKVGGSQLNDIAGESNGRDERSKHGNDDKGPHSLSGTSR